MADWYLNPALTQMRKEVNARWPNRDKASDGTVGDPEHQARSSDHNPDPVGTPTPGSVDAWDKDVELNGVGQPYAEDVEFCKRRFEAHPSSRYWIHNDQICFRDEGWVPRSYAYAGPNRNRHEKHVHYNTRESHENIATPFGIEDEMELNDVVYTAGEGNAAAVPAGPRTVRAILGALDARTSLLTNAGWLSNQFKGILDAINAADDNQIVLTPQQIEELSNLMATAMADVMPTAEEIADATAEETAERMGANPS